MLQLGDRWLFEDETCQTRMIERGTGLEVETLQVSSRDGRRLTSADVGWAAPAVETGSETATPALLP